MRIKTIIQAAIISVVMGCLNMVSAMDNSDNNSKELDELNKRFETAIRKKDYRAIVEILIPAEAKLMPNRFDNIEDTTFDWTEENWYARAIGNSCDSNKSDTLIPKYLVFKEIKGLQTDVIIYIANILIKVDNDFLALELMLNHIQPRIKLQKIQKAIKDLFCFGENRLLISFFLDHPNYSLFIDEKVMDSALWGAYHYNNQGKAKIVLDYYVKKQMTPEISRMISFMRDSKCPETYFMILSYVEKLNMLTKDDIDKVITDNCLTKTDSERLERAMSFLLSLSEDGKKPSQTIIDSFIQKFILSGDCNKKENLVNLTLFLNQWKPESNLINKIFSDVCSLENNIWITLFLNQPEDQPRPSQECIEDNFNTAQSLRRLETLSVFLNQQEGQLRPHQECIDYNYGVLARIPNPSDEVLQIKALLGKFSSNL